MNFCYFRKINNNVELEMQFSEKNNVSCNSLEFFKKEGCNIVRY